MLVLSKMSFRHFLGVKLWTSSERSQSSKNPLEPLVKMKKKETFHQTVLGGGFYPFEKYLSKWVHLPQERDENSKNLWNHQLELIFFPKNSHFEAKKGGVDLPRWFSFAEEHFQVPAVSFCGEHSKYYLETQTRQKKKHHQTHPSTETFPKLNRIPKKHNIQLILARLWNFTNLNLPESSGVPFPFQQKATFFGGLYRSCEVAS